MAGAGYYVFNQAVAGGEYVTVPNVVGYHITDASDILIEKGLDLDLRSAVQIVSDDMPQHYVIAQRPTAGVVVRAGRKIIPTISKGTVHVPAPDLVNKTLEEARNLIEEGHFRVGTHARIAHATRPDTVIGQDPAPGRDVSRGAEIHLLVSNGLGSRASLMPDWAGKPLQEVMQVAAGLGLEAIANPVDAPGAAYDIVLAQEPAPGTLVRQGQQVIFDVRMSVATRPAATERKVKVVYKVPFSWYDREVRMVAIDKDGRRSTLFPLPQDFVNGAPPKYPSGTKITVDLSFLEEVTVEVYLDGEKAVSYYYQGTADPVITDHRLPSGGVDSA